MLSNNNLKPFLNKIKMFLTQQNRVSMSPQTLPKPKTVFNIFSVNAIIEEIQESALVLKTQSFIDGKQFYAHIHGICPNSFKIGDLVYPQQVVGKEAWENSISINTFFK